MEKRITKINGVEISAVEKNGEVYLPVKPICEAIGVDHKRQQDKIKEDPILAPVGGFSPSTGADGKTYEMFCLPLQYVFGWLFTINPAKVAPDAKANVIKYKKECYDALYRHFVGRMNRTIDAAKQEISILKRKEEIAEAKKELTNEDRQLDRQLRDLQASRLDPQPSLFD